VVSGGWGCYRGQERCSWKRGDGERRMADGGKGVQDRRESKVIRAGEALTGQGVMVHNICSYSTVFGSAQLSNLRGSQRLMGQTQQNHGTLYNMIKRSI